MTAHEGADMDMIYGVIRIMAVLFMLAALNVGNVGAQTGDKTPAESAKMIARTIDASTPKTPNAPITFVSATSHDNIVEILYSVKDAALFTNAKLRQEGMRLQIVQYFCSVGRIEYINSRVVILQSYVLSDKSDRIEITIDKSSCR